MKKADADRLIKAAFKDGTLNVMKMGVDKPNPGYALVFPFEKEAAVKANAQLLEAVAVVFGSFQPRFLLPGMAHGGHKSFTFDDENKAKFACRKCIVCLKFSTT